MINTSIICSAITFLPHPRISPLLSQLTKVVISNGAAGEILPLAATQAERPDISQFVMVRQTGNGHYHKLAVHSAQRRIKVAETKAGKSFPQLRQPIEDAKGGTGRNECDRIEIPVRIHIQVAELDKIGAAISKQTT
jgi:hypothetical protein